MLYSVAALVRPMNPDTIDGFTQLNLLSTLALSWKSPELATKEAKQRLSGEGYDVVEILLRPATDELLVEIAHIPETIAALERAKKSDAK